AMRDLPERMHAGISTARTMHAHVRAAGRLDGSFQRTLHRRMIGLELPAGKRRAVIFDDELVAGHLCFRSSLPGLTRQSIFFKRTLFSRWMPGSSPGMTISDKSRP